MLPLPESLPQLFVAVAVYTAVGVVSLTLLVMALRFLLTPAHTVHKTGVVLVTGAATGIGLETVQLLAREGYSVIAGCLNDEQKGDVERVARETQLDITALQLNICCNDEVKDALEFVKNKCREQMLPFVALVNNAAVMSFFPFEVTPESQVKASFAVNCEGTWRMTSTFLPLLREHSARVVTVASGAGHIASSCLGIYSATKHAIEGMMDALRREIHDQGVAVSIVEPGSILAGFTYTGAGDAARNAWNERVKSVHPSASVYTHVWRRYLSFMQRNASRGVPPIVVSHKILRAIRDKRPLARYATTDAIPAKPMHGLLPGAVEDMIMRLT